MLLNVSLSAYTVGKSFPFKVTIESCPITDIHVTHPAQLHIIYPLGDPPHEEDIPETFLTPEDCGQ